MAMELSKSVLRSKGYYIVKRRIGYWLSTKRRGQLLKHMLWKSVYDFLFSFFYNGPYDVHSRI